MCAGELYVWLMALVSLPGAYPSILGLFDCPADVVSDRSPLPCSAAQFVLAHCVGAHTSSTPLSLSLLEAQ